MVHLDLKRADGLKHVIQFAARRLGQVEIQPMRADVQPTPGKLTLFENAQPCPRPPKDAMIVGRGSEEPACSGSSPNLEWKEQPCLITLSDRMLTRIRRGLPLT